MGGDDGETAWGAGGSRQEPTPSAFLAQQVGDREGARTVFRADLESGPEPDAWFKAFPPEWTF